MAVGSLTRDNARHSNSNSQPGGSHGQEDPVRRRRSHWELHRVVPVKGRPRRDARRSRGPSRSETIRKKGISVTGSARPVRRRTRRPCICNESQRLPRDFDLAFVAMKVYDTAWAAQLALRHLQPAGYIVASENCWPDPIVAVGGRRLALASGSSCRRSAWRCGSRAQVERGCREGPGHRARRLPRGRARRQDHARANEVAEMLKVIDGSQATDNLWGERWAKLCANAMGNPVQAMSGLGSFEIASSEVGRAITIHLGARVRAGRAGARLPRAEFNGTTVDQWAAADRRETCTTRSTGCSRRPRPAGATGAPRWRQDVTKGRPTEIDYMNGYVVAQGRERGVPTPVSRRPSRPSVRSTPVRASRTPRTSVSCSSAPGV